jgi:hypothetical protein
VRGGNKLPALAHVAGDALEKRRKPWCMGSISRIGRGLKCGSIGALGHRQHARKKTVKDYAAPRTSKNRVLVFDVTTCSACRENISQARDNAKVDNIQHQRCRQHQLGAYAASQVRLRVIREAPGADEGEFAPGPCPQFRPGLRRAWLAAAMARLCRGANKLNQLPGKDR